MQKPDPGGTAELLEALAVWEARACFHLSVLIDRYLSEQPSPAQGGVEKWFGHWAARLRAHGLAHLEELEQPHLQVLPDAR